jgi:uncharacterized protein (TIGR03435 family)
MQQRHWPIHIAAFAAAVLVGQVLSAQAPTFDVASIKRHVGNEVGNFIPSPPGQFRAVNVRIVQFLGIAWDMPMGIAYGIKGLPNWANQEGYDIEFKWPANTPREQMTEMARAMFAERFKLVVHYEPIDDPSFALTVARADGRPGPGLTRSTLDCDAVGAAARAGQPLPDLPNGAGPCRMWESNDTILAGGITMAELAPHLTGPSGRQVVDRTGLEGRWEFVLHYSRQERDPNASPGLYPSLFTALQTELGLKLVPFVGKNKLLVIDHIERPTEN